MSKVSKKSKGGVISKDVYEKALKQYFCNGEKVFSEERVEYLIGSFFNTVNENLNVNKDNKTGSKYIIPFMKRMEFLYNIGLVKSDGKESTLDNYTQKHKEEILSNYSQEELEEAVFNKIPGYESVKDNLVDVLLKHKISKDIVFSLLCSVAKHLLCDYKYDNFNNFNPDDLDPVSVINSFIKYNKGYKRQGFRSGIDSLVKKYKSEGRKVKPSKSKKVKRSAKSVVEKVKKVKTPKLKKVKKEELDKLDEIKPTEEKKISPPSSAGGPPKRPAGNIPKPTTPSSAGGPPKRPAGNVPITPKPTKITAPAPPGAKPAVKKAPKAPSPKAKPSRDKGIEELLMNLDSSILNEGTEILSLTHKIKDLVKGDYSTLSQVIKLLGDVELYKSSSGLIKLTDVESEVGYFLDFLKNVNKEIYDNFIPEEDIPLLFYLLVSNAYKNYVKDSSPEKFFEKMIKEEDKDLSLRAVTLWYNPHFFKNKGAEIVFKNSRMYQYLDEYYDLLKLKDNYKKSGVKIKKEKKTSFNVEKETKDTLEVLETFGADEEEIKPVPIKPVVKKAPKAPGPVSSTPTPVLKAPKAPGPVSSTPTPVKKAPGFPPAPKAPGPVDNSSAPVNTETGKVLPPPPPPNPAGPPPGGPPGPPPGPPGGPRPAPAVVEKPQTELKKIFAILEERGLKNTAENRDMISRELKGLPPKPPSTKTTETKTESKETFYQQVVQIVEKEVSTFTEGKELPSNLKLTQKRAILGDFIKLIESEYDVEDDIRSDQMKQFKLLNKFLAGKSEIDKLEEYQKEVLKE